jgi:uncharacterized protein YggT (Ycf19 family)
VETILYIFAKCIEIILYFTMLCMMIRAILPIFVDVEDNKLYTFALVVSEPFVIPVRFLFYKLNIGQESPIDWSFFATYLILSITTMLLPII